MTPPRRICDIARLPLPCINAWIIAKLMKWPKAKRSRLRFQHRAATLLFDYPAPSMASRIGLYGGTLAVLAGGLVGVGAYTFHYAEGFSYFSKDPAACVNCHIMQPQYDSWLKSSHHAVATCIDCHLPHDFPHNLIAKADNGWRHSWAFTFQDFHEPIQVIPRNKRILEDNCRDCHESVVSQMVAHHVPAEGKDRINCVHCHAGVGHGPVR